MHGKIQCDYACDLAKCVVVTLRKAISRYKMLQKVPFIINLI